MALEIICIREMGLIREGMLHCAGASSWELRSRESVFQKETFARLSALTREGQEDRAYARAGDRGLC